MSFATCRRAPSFSDRRPTWNESVFVHEHPLRTVHRFFSATVSPSCRRIYPFHSRYFPIAFPPRLFYYLPPKPGVVWLSSLVHLLAFSGPVPVDSLATPHKTISPTSYRSLGRGYIEPAWCGSGGSHPGEGRGRGKGAELCLSVFLRLAL